MLSILFSILIKGIAISTTFTLQHYNLQAYAVKLKSKLFVLEQV